MAHDESLEEMPPDRTGQGRHFSPTHWELIVRARQAGAPRKAALDELCRLYWYPIYAFLRRERHAREEAEDLTQGFFAFPSFAFATFPKDRGDV